MLFGFAIIAFAIMAVALVALRGLSNDELDQKAPADLPSQAQVVLERGPSSRAYLALAPILCAMAGVLVIASPLRAYAPDPVPFALAFAAVTLLSIPAAVRAWDRVIANDQTLTRKSLIRIRTTSLEWSDISKVEYHRLGACLILRSRDGRRIRVDVATRTFPAFVFMMARRLPQISKEALHDMPITLIDEWP
jgi:hypothetical protein